MFGIVVFDAVTDWRIANSFGSSSESLFAYENGIMRREIEGCQAHNFVCQRARISDVVSRFIHPVM